MNAINCKISVLIFPSYFYSFFLVWCYKNTFIKKKNYSPETNGKIHKKLIKNKDKFKVEQKTVFHKIKNRLSITFIPTLQYVKPILGTIITSVI